MTGQTDAPTRHDPELWRQTHVVMVGGAGMVVSHAS
jgi:hypothetical protein